MKSTIFAISVLLAAHSAFAECTKEASIHGVKWYLSEDNQSCAVTCAERGGYNSHATSTAGIEGNLATCREVMTQLCAPATSYRVGDVNCEKGNYGVADGAGCFTYVHNFEQRSSGWSFRCVSGAPTSAEALPGPGMSRACACNE